MDLFRFCEDTFEGIIARGAWPCDLPPSTYAENYSWRISRIELETYFWFIAAISHWIIVRSKVRSREQQLYKRQRRLPVNVIRKILKPLLPRPTMSVYSDQGYSRARPLVFTHKRRSPIQEHPKFVFLYSCCRVLDLNTVSTVATFFRWVTAMPGTTRPMAMIRTKKNSVLAHGKVIGVIKLPKEPDGSAEEKSRLGVRKWMTGRFVLQFTRPLYPYV